MCLFLWKAEIKGTKIKGKSLKTAFEALKVDTVPKVSQSLDSLAIETCETEQSFEPFYKWIFQHALSVKSTKNLDIKTALELWKMAFSKRDCVFFNDWKKYFHEHPDIKVITHHQWNTFLEFLERFKSDSSTYEEKDYWPKLFGEFVANQKKNII